MNVLLLILQYPPDVNTTGLLMHQVATDLAARDHRVSVITSFPHYERFRIWDEYRGKIFQRRMEHGISVVRVWVYASGSKNHMLNRLFSYLSFTVLATLAAMVSRERYDVILCPNGGFFTGLAGAIIGSIKHAPFVYNVQDLYPETPVHAGQLRNKAAIVVLELLERFMYRTAAFVSVIARSFRANIIDKGVDPAKIDVIPNFVDSDFIRPLPRTNSFSQQHRLDDKFVVTHAGNLGFVYDFDALLGAAALLRHEPDVVFLVIGDGVMRESIMRRAREQNLTNIRFLPFQPREQLPLVRAASDIQLALYKSGAARYSMPSKVYEIMASSRPVLASAEPYTDLERLVTETRCGMCIQPESPAQLARAIVELRVEPELRRRMGERGRAEIERHYSRAAVVNQYDELLRAVAMPVQEEVRYGNHFTSRV
jgi:colanic acid biosynthesis glycosyl transferase WcaI